MSKISLAAQHLVKHYAGVTALADGNLDVRSGEVLALVGANGSGKSTLSKIITGVVAPDAGQLLLDEKNVRFSSPHAAQKQGIVEVYQELSLIPDMTVAENIWLAHEPVTWLRLVRNREQRARTRDLLDLFAGTTSSALEPDTPVSLLAPDEKQIVEILKALSLQPRAIFLDEATASLDSRQVNRLFELIENWKRQDMAVVFISHRMEEIFRIADGATVLRSGSSVGTVQLSESSEREIVAMMIEASEGASHLRRASEEAARTTEFAVRLRVEALHTESLRGVSFELRDGEILGLGGLRGQGQNEILLALFGALPFSGNVQLSERKVHFTHPRQAMRAGLAFVPGDRGSEGLLPVRSILENLHLPSWWRYGALLRMNQAQKDARNITEKLNMVMASLQAPVSSLSGGNAQKVVLGKWLLREPKILLLDDPTRGVDVGAKGEFYKLLSALREAGAAILLYSSDDEELLNLCSRVLVLHDGQIEAELTGMSLTRAELVAASMGTGGR